jgi:hypothetical protein
MQSLSFLPFFCCIQHPVVGNLRQWTVELQSSILLTSGLLISTYVRFSVPRWATAKCWPSPLDLAAQLSMMWRM